MDRHGIVVRRAWVVATCIAGLTTPCLADKGDLNSSINRREEASWQQAMAIWAWAEPGYQEEKSSALLARTLEDAGFEVKRGIAGMATAFTATFGSGEPVIGILGEFDALPGLSQEVVPYPQSRDGATWGHGCGHHLFGVASTSAAIALAEQMRTGDLKGTLRYYGCPAEEGGAGKVFLVSAGLFNDCDAVLHWHPSDKNSAGDVTSLARIAAKFRFFGKAAHAAGAPQAGRSALDAVELTAHASELLREHTPEAARIHHVITSGGDAPNVVPAFAEIYYYVRHPTAHDVRSIYRRLELCAQAGALATETRLETDYEGGIVEIMPNSSLSEIVLGNLKELCDLELNEDERQFALRIRETFEDAKPLSEIGQVVDRTGQTGKGSTDVGDVSWVVPTSGFTTACFVPGTPGHSWQAVACGGTSIGRKGMHLAARVLAASAWDLFHKPETLKAAKAELHRRLGDRKYETLMLPGQKPPLDYRNPPKKAPASGSKQAAQK